MSRAILDGQVRRLVGRAARGAPPLAPLPAMALAGPPQPGRLPVRHLQRRLCARLRLRLLLATQILCSCMAPDTHAQCSGQEHKSKGRSFTSLNGQRQEQITARHGPLLTRARRPSTKMRQGAWAGSHLGRLSIILDWWMVQLPLSPAQTPLYLKSVTHIGAFLHSARACPIDAVPKTLPVHTALSMMHMPASLCASGKPTFPSLSPGLAPCQPGAHFEGWVPPAQGEPESAAQSQHRCCLAASWAAARLLGACHPWAAHPARPRLLSAQNPCPLAQHLQQRLMVSW